MNRTILLRGRVITYELERKPVKNLNLRIRADGSVHVSVNRRVGLAQVERFLTDKRIFSFPPSTGTKRQGARCLRRKSTSTGRLSRFSVNLYV
mgnify:CR=1 FL=1